MDDQKATEGEVAGAIILLCSQAMAEDSLADCLCEALDKLLALAGIEPEHIGSDVVLQAARKRLNGK